MKLAVLETEERLVDEDGGVEKRDGERVNGRMVFEPELRGLGVVAGVGKSPTRESWRSMREAGRAL